MSPGLVPGVNGAEGDGSGAAAGPGHKGQNTRAPRGTDGDRGGNSGGDTGREEAPQGGSGYRGPRGYRLRVSTRDPCGAPHSPPVLLSPPPFPQVPSIPAGPPSPFGCFQPLWVLPLPDPRRPLLSGFIPAPLALVPGRGSRGSLAVSPRCLPCAPGRGWRCRALGSP